LVAYDGKVRIVILMSRKIITVRPATVTVSVNTLPLTIEPSVKLSTNGWSRFFAVKLADVLYVRCP